MHYVDVPSNQGGTAGDDLVGLAHTFHWEDWRELRFADVSSELYRRGVARLVSRLVDANAQAEQVMIAAPVSALEQLSDTGGDNGPGLLDRLATAEATFPRWLATIHTLFPAIETIGRLLQQLREDIQRGDAQGGGFAARLVAARRVAGQMNEPSELVWSLGKQFVSQLHELDRGYRALIERTAGEVRENPTSRPAVCQFFGRVRTLSLGTRQALDAFQLLIDAAAHAEAMSRDLRPPLRRLRQGLTIMSEAREVTDDWIRLIEASGVRCDASQ